MADMAANVAMDLDPEVHRYIFVDGPPDPDVHREDIRTRIAAGGPQQGGIWVVEWKDRPGFLGWCGLFPLRDTEFIELGYRYVRNAWGRGVGTEAARRVLEHGFRVLGLDPIVAIALPANRASRRVLAKVGLQPAGTVTHSGLLHNFYRLTRAEFEDMADQNRTTAC